jgi:hypothetical protein
LPALFGDDPNWGNGFFFAIPYGAEEPTIAHIMSRLIEQRGMVPKGEGIRGWGDFVGEFAARVFTYDYELEDELQRRCHTMHMSPMERIDPDKPLYRIHSDYEPEPFGINYVRLDADPKAAEITVDFRGMQDPDIHSDWRACIIAVENDGKRRYTPLWNAGRMSMAVGPDDSAHFLSVAATPTALPKDNYNTGFSHSTLTVGQYAPKYPWEAEITGAVPGAPVKRLGDVGYVETGHQGVLYAPRRATGEVLARFQEHYAKIREQAVMIPGTQDEACDRFAAVLNLTTYKTAIDMMAPGRPHPNGGGWVSDSAKVAETAYVGPNAMVIGQSEVSDNAIIEGNAIVIGNSRITGNAKVSDGVVIDGETLDGFSRKWRPGKMHHELPRRWTTMKGFSDHNVERLWVNHAMNGEGGIRLNDYYYMAGPADQFLTFRETGPQLHGFVYGKPEYAKVDGKWGMRIKNAAQYGMLNPRAADLGEITLALTLRRETASAGTVLDLGVDTDNAMVLTLRKSGTPRFVATSGGKDVVKLSGKTKIPLNQWASVRVELDGRTASLFVDGKKEASTGTTFRASDVYLPDAVRRNYLGNSRTRKSPFIGVLDELVIYYTVHPDFADLMPPVVHCPYRPTEGALEAVEAYAKAYDAYMSKKKAAEDAKKKADEAAKKEAAEPSDAPETTVLAVRPTNSTLEEKQKYYADLKKRMSQRMGELDAAHPQMAKLVSEIDRLNKEIRDQTSKAKKEFYETPYAKKIEAERLAAHKRMHKVNREDNARFNEFKESRPEFQAEMQVIHEQKETIKAEWNKIPKEQRTKALEKKHSMRLHRLVKQSRTIEHRYRRIYRMQNPEMAERVNAAKQEAHAGNSIVHEAQKAYLTPRIQPIKTRIAELKEQKRKLQGEVDAPVRPEKSALGENLRGYFADYWNKSIANYSKRFHKQKEEGQVSGRVSVPAADDRHRVRAALKAWSTPEDTWSTSVDWDWRIREEVDGRIARLPLLQKWLQRARGPVLKNRPVDANPKQ